MSSMNLSPEEYRRQVTQWVTQLSPLFGNPGSWQALQDFFEDETKEALDWALHHDTPEDKRAGWCGRAQAYRDLLQWLQEMRSGEFKNWPEFQSAAKSEDEDNDRDS